MKDKGNPTKKKKPPLVFDDEKEAATDVDKLVSQGFEREAARDALAMSSGNIILAQRYLTETFDSSAAPTPSRMAWTGELPGEWKERDFTSAQESRGSIINTEARALWKSPYYIRVGDYERKIVPSSSIFSSKDHEIVGYCLHVISRDGSSWRVSKTLSDFFLFWTKLPFGLGLHSKLHLKTGFPLWKLNTMSLKSLVMGTFRGHITDKEIEERREALENWLRELCLDEECMTHPQFLAVLENFIEADRHRTLNTASSHDHTRGKSSDGSGFLHKSFRATNSFQNWTHLPQHKLSGPFPVPYLRMVAELPTKLDLEEVFGETYQDSNAMAENITNKDSTTAQLEKDMSRDRIVIQGARFQGVDTSLDTLLQSCAQAVNLVLEESHGLPVPDDAIAEISQRALRQASRTESAYMSHMALSIAVSLEDCPDLTIVPESQLAEPIRIHFRVADDKASSKEAPPPSAPEKSSIATATPLVVDCHEHSNHALVSAHVVGDDHVSILSDSSDSPYPTAPACHSGDFSTVEVVEHLQGPSGHNPFDMGEVSSATPSSSAPPIQRSLSIHSVDSTGSNSPFFKTPAPKATKKPSDSHPLGGRRRSAPNLFGSASSSSSQSSVQATSKKGAIPLPSKRSPLSPPHPASAKQRERTSKEMVQKNVICDLQATTVFRFTNVLTMECVLQLRVTYCKSIKLILPTSDSGSKKGNESNDEKDSEESQPFSFKSSKCFLVLERETQTSRRDWRHDQTL